ncbi:glutathione ABC transporter substrate-binding protein [Kurthia massiliensis]|uniref:glutathione ABC transporter substrate-binding protein n=1 Tax=Kurthia massiliensis TaxID=1033739 RepID=UPI000289E08F|nr:glutathione ABC transporter substrate-binding protein [Kurthia massiliensis]
MKKRWIIAFLLLLVLTVLTACGSTSNESNSANNSDGKKANQDLVIAVSQNFVTLDPQDSNNTMDNTVQKTIMEGLVAFDEEMNIVPKLATDYKVNKDATEFTFTLRQGVKFHDGEDFNAEAVKANFERISNEDNNLKRYTLFASIDKVEVIDEHKVKIILSEPFASMMNNFAHPAALMQSPKSLASDENIARQPVGTGPYVFESWDSSDIIKVKKNADYWGEAPAANSITFKPVVENGSRTAMLQTGEADFAYPIPTEQIDSLKKANVDIVSSDSIVMNYLSMNVAKKPFDNPKVREAISLAINKDDLVKVVYADYAKKATSVISESTKFYTKQEDQVYDIEKAKQLLKEAGLEDGFSTTVWATNTTNYIKAMEFIQQSLAQLNIDVKVEPMENGTLESALWEPKGPEDSKVEMYFGGWGPSTAEADWGIRPVFATESFPPNSYNISYYSNKDVDKSLQAALRTSDEEERQEIYSKIQKNLWEENVWVPAANPNNIFGKKKNLEGITLLPDGSLYVETLKINE